MGTITRPEPGAKVFDNFFGRMAGRVDKYTEAHKVGVMVSLISLYSSYIGNAPRIVTRGKAMPLGFWAILCGLSGKGRKGTATDLAVDIVQRGLPTFINGNVQYGFDSGLGVTIELHSRLGGEYAPGPDPIFIYEEEMSKFVEQGKKDRRLGTTTTKLWDGSTIQYKTAKDFFEVPHPHAGFVGHMQPKLMAGTRNSKDSAGGTWNRFLFFWVERSKTVDIFSDMPDYDRIMEECGADFRRSAQNAREITRVRVPENVAKIFARVHRPAVEALTNTSEEISEFAERAMAYLLRVAALYALADGVQWISLAHLDAALDLVRYSVSSLQYILSNDRTFSGRSILATKVLEFVKKHGPCTFTKMTTHVGRHYDKNSYMGALLELEGEVVLYTKPNGSRRGPVAKYVATMESILPPDAVVLTIQEIDPDEVMDGEDVTNHPNYRVSEETVTAERVDEPVDATVVDDPQEQPEIALKAIAPPKVSRTRGEHTDARIERRKWLEGRFYILATELAEDTITPDGIAELLATEEELKGMGAMTEEGKPVAPWPANPQTPPTRPNPRKEGRKVMPKVDGVASWF